MCGGMIRWVADCRSSSHCLFPALLVAAVSDCATLRHSLHKRLSPLLQWELLTWGIPWEDRNAFQVCPGRGMAWQALEHIRLKLHPSVYIVDGRCIPVLHIHACANPYQLGSPRCGAPTCPLPPAGAHGQRRGAAGGAGARGGGRRCTRPRALRSLCGADPALLGTAARAAAWIRRNHSGPEASWVGGWQLQGLWRGQG